MCFNNYIMCWKTRHTTADMTHSVTHQCSHILRLFPHVMIWCSMTGKWCEHSIVIHLPCTGGVVLITSEYSTGDGDDSMWLHYFVEYWITAHSVPLRKTLLTNNRKGNEIIQTINEDKYHCRKKQEALWEHKPPPRQLSLTLKANSIAFCNYSFCLICSFYTYWK